MKDKQISILLVEDNEDDYLIVRDILRDVWQEGSGLWHQLAGASSAALPAAPLDVPLEDVPLEDAPLEDAPLDAGEQAFELMWASTYEEGLKMLSQHRPDVVLLDYFLDVGTGLELFREARAAGCQSPVILLTGQNNHEVDVEAMQAGIEDYLVKDHLSGAMLERTIRYALDRHRAAQALRQSERRFRALIENSGEGILLLDADAQISYVSPSAERILGYAPETMLGLSARDLIHPDEHEALNGQLQALLAAPGATQVWQHQVRDPNGTWRWIESSVTNLLDDPSVGALVNNLRDISERISAETELRQSEMRYRTLFETNPQPCWVYERESLRFLAVNHAARQHYGFSQSEFLAMTLRDIRRAGDVDDLLNALHSELKSGRQDRVWQHQRKDGSLIQVELSSNELLYDGREARLVVVNDITRRERDQETLRRSEERYRSLVRASAQIFWIANADASILLSADLTDFTGQSSTQICNLGWIDAVHPEDQAQVRAAWLQAVAHKQIYVGEYRLRGANGTYHFMATRAVPILAGGGTIGEWVGMTSDISARKDAEAERDRFFTLSLDLMCIASGDGYFKRLNPAFEQVLGFTLEELMAKPLLDFVHPDDRPATGKEVDMMAKVNSNRTFLNRFRCRDGSYRWLSWRAVWRDGLCYATARDITDLKEAEAQLHRSLSLLKATLEATADGILAVDGTGHITDFNRKFLSMWSVPEALAQSAPNDAILSHALEQLIEPELLLRTVQNVSHRHEDTTYDVLHLTDGRIISCYSQLQNLDGEDAGRVWSFRDITHRVQAKAVQDQLTAQVQQERQHLDEILTNVPCIVWEQGLPNCPDSGPDAVKNYVNSYVKTMLGYEVAQWLAAPDFWNQILHPDDRVYATRKRAEIAATGQRDVLQYRLKSSDGRMVWVESHCSAIRGQEGTIIGMRGVIMDVTERVEASQEQARLAMLLENTTDFVSWSNINGHVQYMNPAGRAMIGIGPNEDISTHLIANMHPPWVMDLIGTEGIPRAIDYGVWAGESALLTAAGQEIPVSQVVMAPTNERGEVLFFSTICRDVSQQKKVEAALQKANDELELRVMERTAELELANHELVVAKEEADAANHAKSDFLSRMSHELRTPLNAILGFGQILEMRELAEKEAECVAQILRAGRHLLGLINEVLDIARIEAGRLSLSPEPLDVAHVLSESLDLVRPLAATRRVSLAMASGAPDPQWNVWADRQRLHQVMLNLLSNAIKYNRENGQVTLGCRRLEADEWMTHPRVRIEVGDSGPGLSDHEQKMVFVPFERLGLERSKIEGTGIGLALCRQLVNAMNGQIGVRSEIGQGSTFWVELPCVEGPIALPFPLKNQVPNVAQLIASIPAATVLYIEDNPSNLALMESLLVEVPQIQLLSALRGDTGLESARQHLPDLILLDLHLPGLHGAQVLAQLQIAAQTRDIPVVILSADVTQGQMKELLAAGARRFLSKPLDVEEILQVLGQLLQNKR